MSEHLDGFLTRRRSLIWSANHQYLSTNSKLNTNLIKFQDSGKSVEYQMESKTKYSPTNYWQFAIILLLTIKISTFSPVKGQFHQTEIWQMNSNHHQDQKSSVSSSTISTPASNGANSSFAGGQPKPIDSGADSAVPNFYINSQVQKFRVNVSNICERNQMRVTVRLSKPFYGLIHTKDKRKKSGCFIEGSGEQTYTMELSYTQVQSEPAYCGVVSHQTTLSAAGHLLKQKQHFSPSNGSNLSSQQSQQILSVALVVRLHKSIEFSDDRYFLLSCANRCARTDCSSLAQEMGQTRSQPLQGFVASESIISPMLRPTNELIDGLSNFGLGGSSARLINKDLSNNTNWPTERCDLMLDLKFQWLLKLSWLLSILLLLMFIIVFYLCSTINKLRLSKKNISSQLKRAGDPDLLPPSTSTTTTRTAGSSSTDLSFQPEKQIFYQQHQQQLQHPDQPTSNWRLSQANQLEMGKICGDNSYLARQHHQQLLLSNNFGPETKNSLEQYSQQQVDGSPQVMQLVGNQRRQPVVGRSMDPLVGGPPNDERVKRHLEARVRRRRSIGGFTLLPDASISNGQLNSDHHTDLPSDYQLSSALQRAKSKSQTTIHYDQNKDPFETVPFSYLNSGYLSDDVRATTNRQVYTNADIHLEGSHMAYGVPVAELLGRSNQKPPDHFDEQNQMIATNESIQANQAPPDNIALQVRSRTQDIQRQYPLQNQRWPNLKSSFLAPKQIETKVEINNNHIVQQHQDQLSSQFDPQNSRQLIDLIQHKHRQQIAQATRTAATLNNQQQLVTRQYNENIPWS